MREEIRSTPGEDDFCPCGGLFRLSKGSDSRSCDRCGLAEDEQGVGDQDLEDTLARKQLGLDGPDSLQAGAEGSGERETDSIGSGRSKKSSGQAKKLVELATEHCDFFHTPTKEAFATMKVGEHKETWPLQSRGFREFFAQLSYRAVDRVPSGNPLNDALRALEGLAKYDGPEEDVHTRVAQHDGSIYIDMTDASWRQIRVSPLGYEVVEDSPVRFRRSLQSKPLPEPQGSSLSDLARLVNVPEEMLPLLTPYIAFSLTPGGPFPVLVLTGEQGSAKSTLARIIRDLVDPSHLPLLTPPPNERELMIQARHNWLLAFDNLSGLRPDMSDALARLSTGGGLGTRALYTNDEIVAFQAIRPILLNGISDPVTRSDLLDRSVILTLPAISRRRAVSDVMEEFQETRPSILGGLLSGVSESLRMGLPRNYEPNQRMAEFELFAVRSEVSLGFAPGSFARASRENRREANRVALESAPVAETLLKIARQMGMWEGTATELLTRLNEAAPEAAQKQRGWPKAPNRLSRQLKQVAPNLRSEGVEINWPDREATSRRITVKFLGVPSVSSPSSAVASASDGASSANGHDGSDDENPGTHSTAEDSLGTISKEDEPTFVLLDELADADAGEVAPSPRD